MRACVRACVRERRLTVKGGGIPGRRRTTALEQVDGAVHANLGPDGGV